MSGGAFSTMLATKRSIESLSAESVETCTDLTTVHFFRRVRNKDRAERVLPVLKCEAACVDCQGSFSDTENLSRVATCLKAGRVWDMCFRIFRR